MNGSFANPFDPLEPPRGGLAGLRARIERDARRRRRTQRLSVGIATAVGAGLFALALLTPTAPPERLIRGFSPTGLRLGLADLPAAPVSIPASKRHELAALRVPLEGERVVFYLVASAAPDERPPTEPER